jgi:hypothetical protein
LLKRSKVEDSQGQRPPNETRSLLLNVVCA